MIGAIPIFGPDARRDRTRVGRIKLSNRNIEVFRVHAGDHGAE